MSNQSVPGIYSWIVGDVVEKMSQKFAEVGLDENILTELKENWERRIRVMNIAPFPQPQQPINYQYPNQQPHPDQSYYPINQSLFTNQFQNQIPQNDGADRSTLDSKLLALPQLDGTEDDDEEDEVSNLNQDSPNESEINSDLDDDDDEENMKTDHLILCQYEKVSRIKNKWKCVLKDGVVNINGRDYVFNRANGDFEW